MGKKKISDEKIKKIIELRKNGLSLNEIKKIVPIGKTTIFSYLKNVKTPFDLRNTGSIRKSKREWDNSRKIVSDLLGSISKEGRLLVLACLYWGEGNKRELNLINSDPNLVRVFVNCLYDLGVNKEDLLISIRIYEDINVEKAKNFWAKTIGVNTNNIRSVNILSGRKIGKLEYGMCRIRVRKAGKYFKILISMIDLIKSQI